MDPRNESVAGVCVWAMQLKGPIHNCPTSRAIQENCQTSPRKIMATCSVFSRNGGKINCVVTAPRFSQSAPRRTRGALLLEIERKTRAIMKSEEVCALQKQKPELSEPPVKEAKMEDTVEDMFLTNST